MKDNTTQHKQAQTSVMPFNFGEHEIRVIQDENGEPWFVAHDVAKALGYEKPRNAIARHCKHQSTAPKQGGGFLTLIPESDVYRLTFRSNLESADKFSDWVAEDVLPSIRKHGMYARDEILDNPVLLIEVATKLKEERNHRLFAEQQRDKAISERGQICTTRGAKALGLLGAAKKENKKLKEQLGIAETYKQVKAISWLSDYFDLTKVAYQQIGRKLSSLSADMGILPNEIEDSEYGKIKAYHIDVIEAFKATVKSTPELLVKYRKEVSA